MASIGTLVLNLEAEGINPGSYCYYKQLLRALLEYYNMREDQLTDDVKKNLQSKLKKISEKVNKLKLGKKKSLQELILAMEKVSLFMSFLLVHAYN